MSHKETTEEIINETQHYDEEDEEDPRYYDEDEENGEYTGEEVLNETATVTDTDLPHYFHPLYVPQQPASHYTKIHIYDFDGTLFETPLPDVGIPHYEKKTGRRFPVAGHWWATEESLDLAVFDIASGQAYDDFYKSIVNDDICTMLMTGRNMAIKGAVLSILDKHQMNFHYTIFKPDYYPSTTLAYKLSALRLLASKYENLEEITMWEDRKEHARNFRELHNKLTNKKGFKIKVKVIYVKSVSERNNFGFRRGMRGRGRGGGRGRRGDHNDFRPKSFGSRGGKIYSVDSAGDHKRFKKHHKNNTEEDQDDPNQEVYQYKSKMDQKKQNRGRGRGRGGKQSGSSPKIRQQE